MKTLIEKVVEERVNALLKEVETISKVYIECRQKETNSVVELAHLGAIPKHLEKRLFEVQMTLMLLNMLFPTKA